MTRFLSGLIAGLILAGSVALASDFLFDDFTQQRFERQHFEEQERLNRELRDHIENQELRELLYPC